ncbi:MAG: hypothetical protein M3R52_08510, partial [Acidobacteriota bacterium]|nr:hypothetical protein [Acidobacteriota bacterium]
ILGAVVIGVKAKQSPQGAASSRQPRTAGMFKILIDTCVWLDLAKDPRQVPVLGVVEEMVKLSMIELIVPRLALDEFRRNRERIASESA